MSWWKHAMHRQFDFIKANYMLPCKELYRLSLG